MRAVLLFCICLVLPAFLTRADTLLVANKKIEATVVAVTASDVVLSDKRTVSTKKIQRLVFDHTPVVAQSQGLVLPDGSRLSGTLHELGVDGIRFRSTSLGPLSLTHADVAAVYFTGDFTPADLRSPPKGQVAVVLKTRAVKQGELFMSSATLVVLRTKDGLDKTPLEEILCICMGKAATATRIVLRNGDCLNMPVEWKKTGFSAKVTGHPAVTLALKAIKEVRF